MNSRELIKLIEKNGWELKSIRGSHHKFTHPNFPHSVIIPHPKKDLPKGTANAILKQSGVKK